MKSISVDIPIGPVPRATIDVTCAVADPTVTVQVIPTGVPTGGQIMWRGAEIGANGKLYSIPYYADNILITDTNTDTVSLGPSVTGITHPNPGSKWISADRDANGKIYSSMQGAGGALVIDPAYDSFAPILFNGVPISYSFNTRGTVCVDGYAYGLSYVSTASGFYPVRRFKTSDDSYDGVKSLPIDLSDGPLAQGRPNYLAEGGDSVYARMWGGIDAGNGTIYTVPFSADRIFVIHTDPNADLIELEQGVDFLNGNHPVPTADLSPTKPSESDPNWVPYLHKYSDGVHVPYHQACYCMPRNAWAILKINTTNHRATEIPLPADLIAWMEANHPGQGKSLGTVLGPDGRIWSCPWQTPILIWLDPATDQIGWIDLTAHLNADTTGVSQNWFAYGRASGQAIYYSPAAASVVLKINIYSPRITA